MSFVKALKISAVFVLTLAFSFCMMGCAKIKKADDNEDLQMMPSDIVEDIPTDNNNEEINLTDNQAEENEGIKEEMGMKLHVEKNRLKTEDGKTIQLVGLSTHGIGRYPQFVNKEAFRTIKEDWNCNCIRLAMYTVEEDGYCTFGDKEELKNLVRNGVNYATELGMYVIVDWHILFDLDPNVYKEEAKLFFDEIALELADYDNVLYEICNEPNGDTSWDAVKQYSEEIIPIIRKYDRDAVILVGTPTWSQDIDKALENPLKFANVMYTLHFYAGSHKDDLRERYKACVDAGLPVFVSEFGTCDASGNGANDFESSTTWLDLLDSQEASYMCWNMANKDEASSLISPWCDKVSDWNDDELSESGRWIKNRYNNR